jgi:hypothetical protein
MIFPAFSMMFHDFPDGKNPSEAMEVFGQVVAPPAVGRGARNPRCDIFLVVPGGCQPGSYSKILFELKNVLADEEDYGKDGSFEIWHIWHR